jgi:penicillin-binding protein 2
MSNDKVEKNDLEKWRFRVIYIILTIIFGFFLYRLFSLQILNGQNYSAQAEENRLKDISVQTQRGNLYDRNGIVLAENSASYNVVLVPADLPLDVGTTEEIFRELAALIGVPVTNGVLTDETAKSFTECQTDFGIKEIYTIGDTNAPYSKIRVKCNVDPEIAMEIREKSSIWPGVSIEIETVRHYPTGSLTADIVGFLGPITAENQDYYKGLGFVAGRDKVGFGGAEYSLDEILLGKNGERVVEVDSAGQEIRDVVPPVEPIPGNSITLTIDTRLQQAALTALTDEMDFWNTYLNRIQSQNGVVIAMNPKTGEILAMVSYPSYENNRFERLIPSYYYNQLSEDPLHPLLNHAISAMHPPGSVFKIVAATGALNEKVVTPEQQIPCPGSISVVQKYSANDQGTPREYFSYDRNGHGVCDFLKGVALSDDVYFYKIGGGFENDVPNGGLGIWRLAEYAKALGFDRLTGIELPGEVVGLMPDPTWKRIYRAENWSTGDTYIATIGQGYVLSTPLQVLQSFAIIANDGKYMQPTIVKDVLDAEGNVVKPFEPKLVWDITKDPLINILDENNKPTGEKKVVEPWVVAKLKEALRQVVIDGTASKPMKDLEIPSAGKTGTAEYCDNVAQQKNLCQPEAWPTHSWYVGYAPFDDPEIAVVAFVYNGGEGASVAAPIVERVLESYFDLKAIDAANAGQ